MSELFKIHTVTIKRLGITQTDSMGDPTSYTTANRGTLRTSLVCRVVPISARERFRYGQRDQETSHNVYSLDNPNTDERDQLVFGTRNLFVLSTRNPDELGQYYIQECSEQPPGQEL